MNNLIISCDQYIYRYDIYDDMFVIYKPGDNIVDIYKIENDKWIKKNEFVTNIYNDSLFNTYFTEETFLNVNSRNYYSIACNNIYIYISFIYFIQIYELINNEYIHIKTINKVDFTVYNEEFIDYNHASFRENINGYTNMSRINNNNITIMNGGSVGFLTILPDYTSIFTISTMVIEGYNSIIDNEVINIDDNNLIYIPSDKYIIKIKKLNNDNIWIAYKEIDYSTQLLELTQNLTQNFPSTYYFYNNYSVSNNGKYIGIYLSSYSNYSKVIIYENNNSEYNIVYNSDNIYNISASNNSITINNNILTLYNNINKTLYFFMKINNIWSLTNYTVISKEHIYTNYFQILKSNNKSINFMTISSNNELKLIYTII